MCRRRVPTKGSRERGGGNGELLLSACAGESVRAVGCCLLGDIGAGPGPGLQEARACVRRPEGGVRGMGEKK